MKTLIFIVLTFFSITKGFNQSLIEEYRGCAVERFQLQDYQGAIDYFSRVIEISPKDSMGYFDRGYVKDLIKDYIGAIEDFSKH